MYLREEARNSDVLSNQFENEIVHSEKNKKRAVRDAKRKGHAAIRRRAEEKKE